MDLDVRERLARADGRGGEGGGHLQTDTAVLGGGLLALWGYLLAASTGLVLNAADAPVAVVGFDPVTLLLSAAGAVAAWRLLAGRVDGYLGALLTTWAGAVHAYFREQAAPASGGWFWSLALTVLLLGGLYLFARHERFLPAAEGSA